MTTEPKMEALMDVNEVAEMLGVTRKTVYRWVQKRMIPYCKPMPGPRGALRFVPADLRAWLDARGVPLPPDRL